MNRGAQANLVKTVLLLCVFPLFCLNLCSIVYLRVLVCFRTPRVTYPFFLAFLVFAANKSTLFFQYTYPEGANNKRQTKTSHPPLTPYTLCVLHTRDNKAHPYQHLLQYDLEVAALANLTRMDNNTRSTCLGQNNATQLGRAAKRGGGGKKRDLGKLWEHMRNETYNTTLC